VAVFVNDFGFLLTQADTTNKHDDSEDLTQPGDLLNLVNREEIHKFLTPQHVAGAHIL
jgi:hypothetical protein